MYKHTEISVSLYVHTDFLDIQISTYIYTKTLEIKFTAHPSLVAAAREFLHTTSIPLNDCPLQALL